MKGKGGDMQNPAINKTLLLLTILCAALYFLTGCATAPPVKEAEIREAKEIPSGQKAKPVQLKRVMVKIKRGTVIGSWRLGLLCLPGGEIQVSPGIQSCYCAQAGLVDIIHVGLGL